MRIDARPYANMALRYIISPQLQTEAVLWRRVRSPAGRGAEPCGLARQNTPAEDPRGKNPDRGKGRAGCGRKEAMLTRCRRGAYRSAFCCNSAARPQRQRVRITASAANQRQEQLRLRVLAAPPPPPSEPEGGLLRSQSASAATWHSGSIARAVQDQPLPPARPQSPGGGGGRCCASARWHAHAASTARGAASCAMR